MTDGINQEELRNLMLDKNIEGKIIVLTGATSGIGLAAALQLVNAGGWVIGIGRSPEKCRKAEETLRKSCPDANLQYLTADLSSLKQVRELSEHIKSALAERGIHRIDVLIHNAGTVSSWYTSTDDGFELQFAVNHLTPFLLTHELLPLLKQSPAGRVITLSSGSHFRTRIHWKDVLLRRHYNCLWAYKQSKLANVMFCTEFNRRIDNRSSVRAFAADPGLVNTDIGFKGTTGIARWIWQKRSSSGISPAEAAASLVYLAAEPSLQQRPEVYWKERRPLPPSKYSQSPEETRRLWELSEKMCGI